MGRGKENDVVAGKNNAERRCVGMRVSQGSLLEAVENWGEDEDENRGSNRGG
jgi:hypothetical protein